MQCRNCGQPIYETTVTGTNTKQLIHKFTGCYYCDSVKAKGEFAEPAQAHLPFASSFIEVK